MKASTLKYGVLTLTLSLISIILALLPFHAFLTIWASTVFGHYTALRLWKEVLMAIAGLGVLYLVLFDRKVRLHTLRRKLTWLILAYLVVQIVWGLVAWHKGGASLKAMSYGVLLNCRFLLFFLLAWVVAVRTDRLERRWPKLLLWPSIIVVVFGLLQVFVLPIDFLRHFGYGPDTIGPMATINHNVNYLRYMSTLRGANPLGAYLLLPISALVVLLVRYPRSWNWTKVLLLVGSSAMLLFSFSRSAWIGAVLSIATAILAASPAAWWRRHHRPLIAGAAVVVLLFVGGAFALRGNSGFQNFVFHTQDNSAVKTTSNGAHLTAVRDGLTDIAKTPLGHGPGSAGPASIYNAQPGRIAENYYIQIGQETGWVGLALFVTIVAAVGYILWTRRQMTLALTLLAALVGISFVNLLSHAWTDDTLAYIWWGLAGIAIATPALKKELIEGEAE
jgi:O-antigen ligase